jgi:hypothetical protein
MNMNIPTPKIGAHQPGPQKTNGDFLENSPNDFTVMVFLDIIHRRVFI